MASWDDVRRLALALPETAERLAYGSPFWTINVKQALLADDPDVLFTAKHSDGRPSVLVRLDRISDADLAELVEEAWLARAPKRLAAQHPC